MVQKDSKRGAAASSSVADSAKRSGDGKLRSLSYLGSFAFRNVANEGAERQRVPTPHGRNSEFDGNSWLAAPRAARGHPRRAY